MGTIAIFFLVLVPKLYFVQSYNIYIILSNIKVPLAAGGVHWYSSDTQIQLVFLVREQLLITIFLSTSQNNNRVENPLSTMFQASYRVSIKVDMGTDGMLVTTKLEALRNDEMVGSSTNSNSKKILVKEKSVSDSKGGDKDIISVCDYIDLTKACDVIIDLTGEDK